MAITYGSAAGTIITSFLVTQVLGDQTQQTGNNTIVLDDVPSAATGYGGNVGVGTLGIGDSYDTRRIMIGRGGTIQERIVISDAAGTGNTRILTVHEDWDTNPVQTTDTVDVYYELADVEEGGGGGGISLATRTGLWTLTRIITMGNGTDPAGLAMIGGQALECADRSAADSFLVENNGFFRIGYYAGGLPIAGGVITLTAATDDEPSQSFAAGSDVAFLDTLIWAQVATLSQISSATATVVYDKTKLLKATEECELYGDTIINTSIAGEAKSTEIVRVDDTTVCDGLTLEGVQVLDTIADTTAETLTLEGVVFSGVAGYVDVRQNKTWNLIDPIWDVTTYTQLTWTGTSTGNVLNDRRSIKATVQESDGTLLQNTVVVIYENTISGVIELELTTDVNGYAEDSFVYIAHATNSTTTTYGGHALRADKWLYTPFVATQTSTNNFNGSVVISTDPDIVQTTQATAITAGASITLNQDTNPSSIIKYTGGTGTLTVGATVTQAVSGATGIVTEILDGNSVAGTVHLKTRNATAFTNGNSLSSGGGWAATYTNDTAKDITVWIDAATASLQTVYDYFAARSAEIPLATHGTAIHEWGTSSQARIVYSDGTDFYTNRSGTEGVIVVNVGSGNAYYTLDDGTTYSPPVTYTLSMAGLIGGSVMSLTIVNSSTRAELKYELLTGTTSSYGHSGGETVDILLNSLNYDPNLSDIYDLTLPSGNSSIQFQLIDDLNYDNP